MQKCKRFNYEWHVTVRVVTPTRETTMKTFRLGLLKLAVTVICAAGCLPAPEQALADYYRYTDDGGTVCMTNKLSNVPARYRQRMKVVREATPFAKDTKPKEPEAAPPEAAQVIQQEPVEAPTPPAGAPAGSFPWRKLMIFVAGSVAGLYAVNKAAGSLTSPLLGRVIYLLFFFGIFLFAYKSYADSLVTNYFSIKDKVLDMFKKSNVRQSSELDDGGRKQEEGR